MENLKLKNIELNRVDIQNYKSADKNAISIIINNIRSGLNLGSIFRTADAFNIEKIYITGISPIPPNKEVLKSALGSTESVNWEYYENIMNLVSHLKAENHLLLAIEQTKNSIMLDNFTINYSEKIALIFGNEVDGVDQDIINMCDNVIEIPQFGTKHSLNVAVSAGIVLWDLVQKINLKTQNG